MIFERFEWLTLPNDEAADVPGEKISTYPAHICPQCGWVDADVHFEADAADKTKRRCRSCGAAWYLADDIERFLTKEDIRIPEVNLQREGPRLTGGRCFGPAGPRRLELLLDLVRFGLRKGFDQLMCLHHIKIERFEHQVRTAQTVLRKMRGRALIADEVGLGKTIEAGIIIKELLMRGMAKNILILVPAGLTFQWQEEMAVKFKEDFCVFSGKEKHLSGCRWIASYDRAKRHGVFLKKRWDLVVLDEVHWLKNRSTILWKFVKALKSPFLLALSATPIQNHLVELYNIADVVQPGVLSTIRSFKRTFVMKSNPRQIAPGSARLLKQKLDGIMVRNRRSTCGMALPGRRVGIYYFNLSGREKTLYRRLTRYIKKEFKKEFRQATGMSVHMLGLIVLQRELMSTPAAAGGTLQKIAAREYFPEITKSRLQSLAATAAEISTPAKLTALQHVLARFSEERIVVFTEFISSLNYLKDKTQQAKRPVFALSGHLSQRRRKSVLKDFLASPCGILISTDSGGTGLNLQACRHIINFDLPWNPMKIEQRIGRCDRIGQFEEVVVVTLASRNTIEEYIIDVLAKKLRMFEMVVGETNTVLGQVHHEKSFEQLIADLWLAAPTPAEAKKSFVALGRQLAEARCHYDETKTINSVLN